ncbi:DNA excision repair protein ERCC-2 [Halorientalis persicus]|uniref:DNA excision repair protein ERCC-2 n=1 Tax=Halorientalis persicus TaxID=1367881 RepID=A0A1H8W3P9_9EURY|nr:ATP-dependent DNA helicase [Halorientalis persicus]SEP22163.1 DNA excision repair protein ERCC-2 [Halorientalis persicus]
MPTPTIDWEQTFPYSEPYANQRDAAEQIAETVGNHGYALFEGACGTGKTLAALTAAVEHINDPDSHIERAVVVTSEKQQIDVFEDDLRAINEQLPDDQPPINALTMKGKADYCPWTETGHIGYSEIYGECESLRDAVREPIQGAPMDDQYASLQQMVSSARDLGRTGEPLEGDDWTAPFEDGFERFDGSNYCAFYAGWLKEMMDDERDDAGYQPHGVVTADELLTEGADQGFCPHAMMFSGIENADLLIGNYQHLFDPQTFNAMTSRVLGPETMLICDEAHKLEARVRDQLGDSLALRTLQSAIDEIQFEVIDRADEAGDIIRSILESHDISVQQCREFMEFLDELATRLRQLAEEAIDEADAPVDSPGEEGDNLPESVSLPLRDPERLEPDRISSWVDLAGKSHFMEMAPEIGAAMGEALEEANDAVDSYYKGEIHTDTVGRVLGRWQECDHSQFFREFELDRRARAFEGADDKWERWYNASLELRNCIPAERIADRLEIVGGGVLMSATLAPLDVFAETSGLDVLEERDRPVDHLVYESHFDQDNRASYISTLPQYNYDNRNDPAVQQQYLDTVVDVVTTSDGNVLVGMPNYSEASEMADKLRSDPRVDVANDDILCDQSSSNRETDQLKKEFWAGGKKVLITGLRGTLTTGVDYDGDKLRSTVICGVPMQNTKTDYAKAIKKAYCERFSYDVGFNYAFTIPAVRHARQALGRTIRGETEEGVRVIADERYAYDTDWNHVGQYLPDYVRDEYHPVDPEFLKDRLDAWWSGRRTEAPPEAPSDD